MKLYLMRHGHALDSSNDQARPLSTEGHEQVERTAARLMPMDLKIKKVFHSTLLRAKESANEICHHLELSSPIERQGLKPNDNYSTFGEEVKHLSEDTLFVGHMPFMADVVQYLTDEAMSFNTAEIVAIEITDQKAKMLWRSSKL